MTASTSWAVRHARSAGRSGDAGTTAGFRRGTHLPLDLDRLAPAEWPDGRLAAVHMTPDELRWYGLDDGRLIAAFPFSAYPPDGPLAARRHGNRTHALVSRRDGPVTVDDEGNVSPSQAGSGSTTTLAWTEDGDSPEFTWESDGVRITRGDGSYAIALPVKAGRDVVRLAWVRPGTGPRLVVGDDSGMLHAFDVETGDLNENLGMWAGDGAFDAAGDDDDYVLVAAATSSGTITVRDVTRPRVVRVLDGRAATRRHGAAWVRQPGGALWLATVTADGAVEIHGRGDQPIHTLREPEPITAVRSLTTSDGRLVLLTGTAQGTQVWHPAAPAAPEARFVEERVISTGVNGPIRVRATVRPDGRSLIATLSGRVAVGTVRVWDDSGAWVADDDRLTWDIVWSEDGELVMALQTEIVIRDFDEGRERRLRADAYYLTLSGTRLVAMGIAGPVIPRNLSDGAPVEDLANPVGERKVAVAADRQWRIAAGSESGKLLLWDGKSNGYSEIGVHGDRVTAVAWNTHDGGRPEVASSSADGTVRITDVDSGHRTEFRPGGVVAGVAWAPRRRLVTGSSDGTVRLHDADDGRTVEVLTHTAAVVGVDVIVARDGRARIIAACEDGTIHIWAEPAADPGPTTDPDFHPDRVLHTGGLRSESAQPVVNASGRVLVATAGGVHVVVTDIASGEPVFEPSDTSAEGLTIVQMPGRGVQLGMVRAEQALLDLDTGARAGLVGLNTAGHDISSFRTSKGGCLIAVAGIRGQVEVWDALTGTRLQRPGFTLGMAFTVAFSERIDGTLLLAASSPSDDAQVCTVPDGRLVASIPGALARRLTWVRAGDGTPLLAVPSTLRVDLWDVDGPAPVRRRTLQGHTRTVRQACAAVDGAGRTILITGSSDRTVRVWDPDTGECHQVLDADHLVSCVGVTTLPDGTLLLAAGLNNGRTQLWRTRPPAPPGPALPAPPTAHVVALGTAGMWLPLGLLNDLIALTGPTSADLHDPRLRPLVDNPGIRHLRELRWPTPARPALAALLARGQTGFDDTFRPPTGSPRTQAGELAWALSSGAVPAEPTDLDLAALTAAADAVDSRTITLLSIIGPDAATADPLLPARLAHAAAALPELPAELRGLVGVPEGTDDARAAATSTLRNPGSAGITRHGPPTTLLPTELALPKDVLAVRVAAEHALHRRHPAPARPPVRPVTIVLDTTPVTFGPAEGLLRLVAHLITTRLWASGTTPALVTLTEPDRIEPIHGAAELVALWTSRTLNPPDLATAVTTATTSSSRPVVVLAATGDGLGPPTPGRQLVTTTRYTRAHDSHTHHRLLPGATSAAVMALVTAVLDTAARA